MNTLDALVHRLHFLAREGLPFEGVLHALNEALRGRLGVSFGVWFDPEEKPHLATVAPADLFGEPASNCPWELTGVSDYVVLRRPEGVPFFWKNRHDLPPARAAEIAAAVEEQAGAYNRKAKHHRAIQLKLALLKKAFGEPARQLLRKFDRSYRDAWTAAEANRWIKEAVEDVGLFTPPPKGG